MIFEMILLILGSIAAFFGTELVKKLKAIKLEDGQKAKIRTVAALLSTIVVASLRFIDGELVPENIVDIVEAVSQTIVVWFGAHSLYKATKL